MKTNALILSFFPLSVKKRSKINSMGLTTLVMNFY